MRLPNHIVLDFFSTKSLSTSKYWVTNVLNHTLNTVTSDNLILGKLKKSNLKLDLKLDTIYINNLSKNFSNYTSLNTKNLGIHSTNLYNTLNINFLRKERLYTKLKYSRSPAYDMVSGGAAAIFAGLLGFLISEKFGFELVDSGDFYYLFMYGVFAAFSIRPLLVVMDFKKSFVNLLSIRRVFYFYQVLTLTLLKLFKK